MKSISNRRQTLFRKLQKKKYRYKEGLFLVEGERAVRQLIDNGKITVKSLLWDEAQQLWMRPGWEPVAKSIDSATAGRQLYSELTDTENPQGVVALCEMPEEAGLDQLAGQEGIIVATDRLQDPGNLGTIVRTAAWFGARGLLLGKGTVDLFNPKVIRSMAGSTGAIPHANVNLEVVLDDFEQHGWQVLLLDASKGAEKLNELNPSEKSILVIGNEANGVDGRLFGGAARRAVAIPPAKGTQQVESLNASVALSIGLYALADL